MKRVVLLLLLMTVGQSGFGDGHRVRMMAGIMMKLNHYASDDERAELRAVAMSEDSSAAEKTLALAIAAIQHQSAAGAKQELTALVEDESQPAAVRTLARVVRDINHVPSEADKAALARLLE